MQTAVKLAATVTNQPTGPCDNSYGASTKMLSSSGHENKSEIDVTQRFP